MSQRSRDNYGLIFFLLFSTSLLCTHGALSQQWKSIGPFGRPSMPSDSNSACRSAIGNGRVGAVKFVGSGKNRRVIVCTPFDGIRIAPMSDMKWRRPAMKGMPAIGVADLFSLDRMGKRLVALTGDADGGLDPDYPAMNSESIQSRGLFLSRDGGENWLGPIGIWHRKDSTVDEGFWKYPSLKIARKFIVPKNGRGPWFVVVFTCRYATRGYDSWVYRSTDRGKNWFPVLFKEDGWFKDLMFDPCNSKRIYCCGRTVYRSDDNGSTWSDIGKMGLPPDSVVNRCLISFTRYEPDALYVLVNNRKSGFNELYRSAFPGDSLRRLISGAISPPWRTAFAADPSQKGRFLFSAGNRVNRFESSGNAWRAIPVSSGPHDDIHELTTDHASGSVYASTDGGLFRTFDGGTHWEDLSSGLDAMEGWGVSAANDSGRLVMLCGTQDCGTLLYRPASDGSTENW
ncbi:MAG: hypothetical protein ACKO1U_00045, partial [Bacteroidota bacterium]